MTTTTVKTWIGDKTGRFFVQSPYNTKFVEFCRNCNGKWFGGDKAWGFDARDEQKVREALLLCYATDGETIAPTCLIKFSLGGLDGEKITLGGRVLVERKGRDYRVNLGEGVIVLEGGFPPSGGSVKNPRVDAHEGTILEIRDFPLALARTILPEGDHFDGERSDWWILDTTEPEVAPEPEVPIFIGQSFSLDDICAAIA